jgi:hypothetical protein
MSRTARIGATLLWLSAVGGGAALVGAYIVLQSVFGDDPSAIASAVLLALVAVTFSTAGLLVALRQQRNRIGWILLIIGPLICATFTGFALAAVLTEQRGEHDLLAGIAGSVGILGFFPTFMMLALLLLLFPDGRLPSRRWRLPVAFVLAPMVTEVVYLAVAPIRNVGLARNPIGIDSQFIVATAPIVDTVANLALLGLLLLGVAAVVARFRHADAVSRQQLKWFLASVGVFVALFVVGNTETTEGTTMFDLAGAASLALVPVTICIAILRYRLFEIDRLVSRTVSWAIVSAIVIATFALALLALQAALDRFTEGETLAVAASTLLALAIFQPVRQRVQRAVDRRFDRARYDGERVIEAFSGRLRDQLDLAVLADEVRRVAAETVRPTRSAIWVKSPGPAAGPRARVP